MLSWVVCFIFQDLSYMLWYWLVDFWSSFNIGKIGKLYIGDKSGKGSHKINDIMKGYGDKSRPLI